MATPVKDGKLLAPFVYCVEVIVYSEEFLFSSCLELTCRRLFVLLVLLPASGFELDACSWLSFLEYRAANSTGVIVRYQR